ncbi:helix-turn-helix domain-containing protein [Primorskyibacter sp. S87]|uniref:helix-turn-helix domain-containing protein n=1 Tax=Primorskyibacter sp. S87 TaxID=3415126 RepID=UPI003C7C908F
MQEKELPEDDQETSEEDLWFLPGPPEETNPEDPPWPMAAREGSLEPAVWRGAEAAQFRALLNAGQAAARFAERLRQFPDGVAERMALSTVSAILQEEGIWLGEDRIALYRVLRIGVSDQARDLSRADWAIRRLLAAAGSESPVADLAVFLGRSAVSEPQKIRGEDRPSGIELDGLSDQMHHTLSGTKNCHAFLRATYAFSMWRAEGITPWDELLEPTVAALRIAASDTGFPAGLQFLPLIAGYRLDRHTLEDARGSAEARLTTFCTAVEAGALSGLMALDQLAAWETRAKEATVDLSGRTPPLLIEALMRYPMVSAELVSEVVGNSKAAARRNLNLFLERGLIREVTGQDRYRFWTVTG